MVIVYGIDSPDLDSAAPIIGNALDLAFRPHESDFYGGNYYRCETEHGLIVVQKNLDVLDDKAFEEGWPIDQLILRIGGVDETASTEFAARLQALQSPLAKLLSIRQL
jgi:hypothetical protein